MASISIRLSDAELEVLDSVAQENGVNRSEQIRQGLSKYLDLCKRVQEGNFVVTLPCIKTDELHLALSDIQEMREYLSEVHEYSPISSLLDAIFNAVQYDTALRIIEQQPEELVSFAYDRNDDCIDLYADCRAAQRKGVINKNIKLEK